MLNVKILAPEARTIEWGAKAGREAGNMRVQEAWVYTVDQDGKTSPFPTRIEVVLNRATDSRPAQAPYPAGDYTLHPSSVYIDRNGRLAVTPRLVPVRAQARAAA